MRSEVLAAYCLVLGSVASDTRAFEAIYRLDPERSFVRECVVDACENTPVSGRVELSVDGNTAVLEILRFRGDVDDFARRVWSGSHVGSVGAQFGEELVLWFLIERDQGPEAFIEARVNGDAVSFSGGDFRADGSPLVAYGIVGVARRSELEPSVPVLMVDSEQPRRLRAAGSLLFGFHLSVYASGLVEYSSRRELPGPLAPVEQVDIAYLSAEEIDALRQVLREAGAAGLNGPQAGTGSLDVSTRVTLFWRARSSKQVLLANHFSYPQEPIAPEVRAVDEVLQAFIADHFPPRISRF